MTTIGDLRHLVQIERMVTTTDGMGGHPESTPELVAEVWASIEGMSGRERFAAEGVVGEVSHRVVIRYRDDVVPTMRIVWDQLVLEIARVYDPDGRRRFLEMETVMRPIEVTDIARSWLQAGWLQ